MASPAPSIVRDFDDPYLELVRLLHEATNIEHALLVQYLFAGFSVRPKYAVLMGSGLGPDSTSLLGVAIQEMQHLHRVNTLLLALNASPNLQREDFPIHVDIYPFPLELRPLTPASLARYVYAEAPGDALVPDAAKPPEEQAFIAKVLAQLGGARVNHLGGLYTTILDRLREVMAAPPARVGDLSAFPAMLERIKQQGEGAHYRFFRSVFDGSHPAFSGDSTVWDHPGDERFPSLPIESDRTAFAGDPRAIRDETLRRIAWLSDLHYWIVLALLDLSYRTSDESLTGLATSHMRGPLFSSGIVLAARGCGVPFDLPDMPVSLGRSPDGTRALLIKLVNEADACAQALRAALPQDFPFDVAASTISVLKG